MRIHILGICGTFMGGLALLARALGHEISGSDDKVYPPMSIQLEKSGITLAQGYVPEHLQPAPDLVIVGNALSRGNPAVEYVLNARLPYISGPQWLGETLLRDRHVLAVSGTHGKTTTAGLLAWLLEAAGFSPGFLIGGIPDNFGVSARLGGGRFFVIEADEYDTAFFDKRAKFVHYRPKTLVINNIEYDHADIFRDLSDIRWQFHQMIRTLPGTGRILALAGDPEIEATLKMGCWTEVEYFGDGARWRGKPLLPDCGRFEIYLDGRCLGQVEWPLLGRHNMHNALAALSAAAHAGADPVALLPALGEFRGVWRRLQRLAEVRQITVYDDFAHHPTAIRATLEALRRRVGAQRILAILEPRSNTMRMGVHRDTLASALAGADLVWLYQPPGIGWDMAEATRLLDGRRRVVDAVSTIIEEVAAAARPGDQIVIMSNGGFEDIQRRLIARLEAG